MSRLDEIGDLLRAFELAEVAVAAARSSGAPHRVIIDALRVRAHARLPIEELAPVHLAWLLAVTRELAELLAHVPDPAAPHVAGEGPWIGPDGACRCDVCAWASRRRAVLDRLERGA